MAVDRFSDEIVKNPKLNVNPALKEWNQEGKLRGLKFMRTLWLCEVTGGPFKYTGKPLGEAHEDLYITADEFDEVERRSRTRSITSRCRSAKSRRSWPPSSRGRLR
jgi:Bacterial-like globin